MIHDQPITEVLTLLECFEAMTVGYQLPNQLAMPQNITEQQIHHYTMKED
jgi:hypothetical protein